MSLSKQPYRGTRDFFPAQKRVRDYLFETMSATAESFGHEPYDGPLVEEVELYKAKSGQELINDQIYSFTDRGERFIAIRPEMTPTLARMIAQVHREVPKPIRWYSIPNLMRYEKPQRGRLREHWQFNCDVFGAPALTGELEVITVLVTLLENLGATSEHFEILINDKKIVDALLKDLCQLSDEESYKVIKIIDRSKKVSLEALDKMINETISEAKVVALLKEYLALINFDELVNFCQKHKLDEQAKTLITFLELAKDSGLKDYLVFDPSIVRGLDYYTGIVFEAFDKNPENRRALCGGGSYESLLQIFGEQPVPGVGFGLGDVTLTDFLATHKLLPDLSLPKNDLFLSFQTPEGLSSTLSLARKLRKRGLKVVTTLEATKFKKVFTLAQNAGAKYAALIGEAELKDKTVEFKNLETREQHKLAIDDVVSMVALLKN